MERNKLVLSCRLLMSLFTHVELFRDFLEDSVTSKRLVLNFLCLRSHILLQCNVDERAYVLYSIAFTYTSRDCFLLTSCSCVTYPLEMRAQLSHSRLRTWVL